MMTRERDWPNVEPFVPEWREYVEEMEELDLARLHRVGPLLYQRYLYALVRHYAPLVVVETGVRHGPSTVLICAALPCPESRLYSCDPCYRSQEEATQRIEKSTGTKLSEKCWTFIPGESKTAFTQMPEVWDFFVHDSDHRAPNMTMELTVAWDRLRPGGVLVCDDVEFMRHGAYENFCSRVGVTPTRIGTAAFVLKS